MIRAKMKVLSVTKHYHGAEEWNLEPVTTGTGNESWSKFTPSGSLRLVVTNPETFGKVTPGAMMFVDLSPADEA